MKKSDKSKRLYLDKNKRPYLYFAIFMMVVFQYITGSRSFIPSVFQTLVDCYMLFLIGECYDFIRYKWLGSIIPKPSIISAVIMTLISLCITMFLTLIIHSMDLRVM